ncbi:MAG: PspA/IM30 family protein [Cyanobacteria bacterium J06638_38]
MNDSLSNLDKAVSQNLRELELTVNRLRKLIIQTFLARKRIREEYDYSRSEIARWQKNAWLAVYAGNDYLAKAALLRKRHFEQKVAKLKVQIKLDRNIDIVANLKQNLAALELIVTEIEIPEAMQYSSQACKLSQTRIREINASFIVDAFERVEEKVVSIKENSEGALESSNVGTKQQFSDPWALDNNDDEILVMKAQLFDTSINEIEAANTNLPYFTTLIDAELEELRSQLND